MKTFKEYTMNPTTDSPLTQYTPRNTGYPSLYHPVADLNAQKNARVKKKTEGLWDNIRKKKERIARGSGEKMRKPGEKGAPTPDQIQRAKGG